MKIRKSISNWLFIGVVMLLVQVVLGGITRITGSGLSITKWDIILGSIPPLDLEGWLDTFDQYKETPQYRKINGGMSLQDFKFIFFWEYIHRLWARLMGFVFLLPFIYFVIKKQLNRRIMIRLIIVFILSAITASFGWIMVASGLMDRPWVNAYKLGFHLILAFITYAYLLWTFFIYAYDNIILFVTSRTRNMLGIFIGLIWIQIFVGGLVSGMKAGLFYNTWPSMSGSFIPPILLESKQWNLLNLTLYDQFLFTPSLVQFIHRSIAYLILGLAVYISYSILKSKPIYKFSMVTIFFITLVFIQASLGISILLLAKGSIPVFYGVMHQAIAFLLLGVSLYLSYRTRI